MQSDGGIYSRISLAAEDHNGFSAERLDAYGEWGITADWTLSAKYETVDFSTSNVFDSEGWRVAARRRIWANEKWSSTGEIAILEGAAIGGFRGCDAMGGEISLGVGRTFKLGRYEGYSGLNVGRREHDGGCYHDRLEAIISLQPQPNVYWTAQLWSERGEDDRSDKIDLTRSFVFGQFEFGLGVRQEVSGEFDETAAVLSLAFRNGR